MVSVVSGKITDWTKSWSIAARLTLWYTASAFTLVLLASGFLYWALDRNLQEQAGRRLASKTQILGTLLSESPHGAANLREMEWEWAPREYEAVYVRAIDESGAVLVETPGMSAIVPPGRLSVNPLTAGPARGAEIQTADGRRFRAAAAETRDRGGARYTLEVALDLAHEQELLARYRTRLWMALAAALVLGAVIGRSIARRSLRPLEEIGETARRIRSTTLTERIGAAHLPRELASLAGTFNNMLDRLEDSFGRLAHFSADIAHELRTPVNNLRGEAEVALRRARSAGEYREALASCLEECERLGRIIDNLLFLARAENPTATITREVIHVRRELEKVRDFFEAAAEEQGVALRVDAPTGLDAELDRTLLHRALVNLVSNALAHSKRGGTILLAATATPDGVRIEVRDDGSGIAAADLPHVFDRFYRGDKSRAGGAQNLGLGLAIVRGIARLHGGSIRIDSATGEGTCAALVFPVSVSPSGAEFM